MRRPYKDLSTSTRLECTGRRPFRSSAWRHRRRSEIICQNLLLPRTKNSDQRARRRHSQVRRSNVPRQKLPTHDGANTEPQISRIIRLMVVTGGKRNVSP